MRMKVNLLEHFDSVVVAPGFESKNSYTGLHWDTKLRLIAAALYYKNGYTDAITVGGAKIRKMNESFATLMKRYLMKLGIPEEVIETEEYTFDTASQIEWLSRRVINDAYFAFITDPAQAGHVVELMRGFGISYQNCRIISSESIINLRDENIYHIEFLERLHLSPYWWKWVVREKILELFTRYFDPKGKKLSLLTKGRKN